MNETCDLTDVVEIHDLPVFTTGEYPQGIFTLDDLQALAGSYDPAYHEAPNYLAHEDPEGNRPAGNLAFGWVHRLYVEGDTLFADLTGVPRLFADLVLAGRIKKRSVEIYPDLVGKGPYLRAIAWPMIPQVKALADVRPTQVFSQTAEPFVTISFQEKEPSMNETQTKLMTQPELETRLAALKTELLAESRKVNAAAEVRAFCEQMVLAGKMTPAERETEEPILVEQVEREASKNFAEGEIPRSRKRMNFYRGRESILHPDRPDTADPKPTPANPKLVHYFNEHREFFTRLGVSLDDLARVEAIEANQTNPMVGV